MTARKLPRKRLAELEDDARLLRSWHAWHASELQAALSGEHGDVVARIVDFLRNIDLRSAGALIAIIRAEDWRRIDATTRLVVLHEINSAVTALRERNGLPPFDDSLPGSPLNGGLIIRELLSPPPDGISGKS